MTSPVVVAAKGEAARVRISAVDASNLVHDKRACLPASESVIDYSFRSWVAPRAGGQKYA